MKILIINFVWNYFIIQYQDYLYQNYNLILPKIKLLSQIYDINQYHSKFSALLNQEIYFIHFRNLFFPI